MIRALIFDFNGVLADDDPIHMQAFREVAREEGLEFTDEEYLDKYLPLWKLAVPAEFEDLHRWDFSKFGRGERFVYQRIPQQEFDDTLAQVARWGLDQHLKERTFANLVAAM